MMSILSKDETNEKTVIAKADDTTHLYTILVAVFTPLLLISNIAATKGVLLFDSLHLNLGVIQLDGIITDGAFFVFPIAYIMGDLISEVYGYKAMRRAMWLSFGVALGATAIFSLSLKLPAAPFYANQDAMAGVLGAVPQILLASLTAFIIGTTLNAWTLAKMKARSGEKGLLSRMISSTLVGEATDTFIFCAIAATAIGISSVNDFLNYFIVGFVWKTLVEILLLPISTALIAWVKRAEPSYPKTTA